jgi:hypothetical protein
MKPEIETKIVKIAGVNYSVKKNARACLKFEELSGHSIELYDNTAKDMVHFLYSCLWGGGSRISLDEFLDLIDDEDLSVLVMAYISAFNEPSGEKKKAAR